MNNLADPSTPPGDAPAYLDCAATSPIDPRVAEQVMRYLTVEFGNAGSRTHEYGSRAKAASERAREHIAAVVNARPEEVVFTSGATESNNLALLGLAEFGRATGRMHIVSSQIEHKAVLEPLEALAKQGLDIDLLAPTPGGWVHPDAVVDALRDDTLLVSVMHVNNETGVRQPLLEIAEALGDHPAYLHVDAAQGFGKELAPLRCPRLDLISVSGHKLYAPKGVGALIVRRRGRERPPLTPLLYGGGQERGLRPGTLPVHLVVGLGVAAELAVTEDRDRAEATSAFRQQLLDALAPLTPKLNGDQDRVVPHIVNLSFPGLDAEAVMLALKTLVAISNGSACTSHRYEPSHVLHAMALPEERIRGAVRLSWSHLTPTPDLPAVAAALAGLR
jgi:cysteine desulfurase